MKGRLDELPLEKKGAVQDYEISSLVMKFHRNFITSDEISSSVVQLLYTSDEISSSVVQLLYTSDEISSTFVQLLHTGDEISSTVVQLLYNCCATVERGFCKDLIGGVR